MGVEAMKRRLQRLRRILPKITKCKTCKHLTCQQEAFCHEDRVSSLNFLTTLSATSLATSYCLRWNLNRILVSECLSFQIYLSKFKLRSKFSGRLGRGLEDDMVLGFE